MNSEKIAHIGIAVQNLDESQPFWEDVLGLHFEPREHV
ncbi:MAG: VOC family protein, partial [Candidatus Cloacimonetes bacterium]|nr:VOC family protein [Candidatus Cloacimonadota bacterium]